MPNPFSKLKSFAKPILRDEVYLSIKEAILTGEFPPGERISIGRLLQEIGFSPTPIREALLKLEQEGFVSRLPRGGFVETRSPAINPSISWRVSSTSPRSRLKSRAASRRKPGGTRGPKDRLVEAVFASRRPHQRLCTG